MGAYTIETWLVGMVDYSVPESTFTAILFNNEIAVGTPASAVSLMKRELCLADLYMWLAQSSTATTGEYESDGGWQHQKSAKNVFDRKALQAKAMDIYKKWGSPKADEALVGTIVVKDLY